jgi:hypothetical protein
MKGRAVFADLRADAVGSLPRLLQHERGRQARLIHILHIAHFLDLV